MKQLKVFVSGRVQGVGYREWTRGQAVTLNLCGWVRNLADGRVEAMLIGDEQAVDEMLVRMKTGPRLAAVKDIDVRETTDIEPITGFGITR